MRRDRISGKVMLCAVLTSAVMAVCASCPVFSDELSTDEIIVAEVPEESELLVLPDEEIVGQEIGEAILAEDAEEIPDNNEDILIGDILIIDEQIHEEAENLYDSGTSGSCGESVTYSISPEGVVTISGSGPMKDYKNDTVNICSPFLNSSDIKSAVIEKGVTTIGNGTFEGCDNLESVTISDTVTSIGNDAFAHCDLKEVTLPDSVISIGEYSFYGNRHMTSFIIPDSLTSIGYEAFFDCTSLTSITIPYTVTTIGYSSLGYYVGMVNGQYATKKVDGFTIYGHEGSAAEAYVNSNNWINFVSSSHSFSEWTVAKEATCKEEGISAQTCSICGLARTKDIPVSDHKIVADSAVEPSCLGEGKTEGSHCSICGTVFKSQETLPAKGHSFSDWKTTKEATALSEGVQSRRCSVCGKTENASLPKLSAAVTLNKKKLSLKAGKKAKLKIKTKTFGDEIKQWKSNKTAVATVTKKGVVKAKKKGKCTIILTMKSGAKVKCTVTVK